MPPAPKRRAVEKEDEDGSSFVDRSLEVHPDDPNVLRVKGSEWVRRTVSDSGSEMRKRMLHALSRVLPCIGDILRTPGIVVAGEAVLSAYLGEEEPRCSDIDFFVCGASMSSIWERIGPVLEHLRRTLGIKNITVSGVAVTVHLRDIGHPIQFIPMTSSKTLSDVVTCFDLPVSKIGGEFKDGVFRVYHTPRFEYAMKNRLIVLDGGKADDCLEARLHKYMTRYGFGLWVPNAREFMKRTPKKTGPPHGLGGLISIAASARGEATPTYDMLRGPEHSRRVYLRDWMETGWEE